VTNTGSVVLLNNTDLTLLGTITNEGVISLQSNYNDTELQIGPAGVPGTVTLTAPARSCSAITRITTSSAAGPRIR